MQLNHFCETTPNVFHYKKCIKKLFYLPKKKENVLNIQYASIIYSNNRNIIILNKPSWIMLLQIG